MLHLYVLPLLIILALAVAGCASTGPTGEPNRVVTHEDLRAIAWGGGYVGGLTVGESFLKKSKVQPADLLEMAASVELVRSLVNQLGSPVDLHAEIMPRAEKLVSEKVTRPELQRLVLAVISSGVRHAEAELDTRVEFKLDLRWVQIVDEIFAGAAAGLRDASGMNALALQPTGAAAKDWRYEPQAPRDRLSHLSAPHQRVRV